MGNCHIEKLRAKKPRFWIAINSKFQPANNVVKGLAVDPDNKCD